MRITNQEMNEADSTGYDSKTEQCIVQIKQCICMSRLPHFRVDTCQYCFTFSISTEEE